MSILWHLVMKYGNQVGKSSGGIPAIRIAALERYDLFLKQNTTVELNFKSSFD